MEGIAIFVTVLFVLQLFIGLPIAAVCLSREAGVAIDLYRKRGGETGAIDATAMAASEPKWRIFPATPADLQTPFILLFKLLAITWLALFCAELMGGAVNKFVVALILGILFKELGLLEARILEKANGAGLTLFLLFLLVYWYLPKATPESLMTMIYPIFIVFFLGIVAVAVTAFGMSKIFGYSWRLCMAIGISCMFGFPGTYIIPEEVAKAHGKNEEERSYLLALFLSSSKAQTLPLTVAAQNATRGPQWWYMSVLILIMIAPVIVMAIVLERYIARGLLVGAVKG